MLFSRMHINNWNIYINICLASFYVNLFLQCKKKGKWINSIWIAFLSNDIHACKRFVVVNTLLIFSYRINLFNTFNLTSHLCSMVICKFFWDSAAKAIFMGWRFFINTQRRALCYFLPGKFKLEPLSNRKFKTIRDLFLAKIWNLMYICEKTVMWRRQCSFIKITVIQLETSFVW